MSTCYITIKNASEISGKSIQTIRRLVKAKKVKFKRDKTPQGFNYLIDETSFKEYYNIAREHAKVEKKEVKAKAVEVEVEAEADQPKETTKALAGKVEFEAAVEFNETLRHMIKQHSTEKESLFKLIDSFQGKVIALENRLKIETEKQNKPWYKIW